MKRIFALILLFIVSICLCACNTETKHSNVEYPLKEVNIIYDNYSNIIQQTIYNELTEEYTTTIFTYEYKNGFWNCISQSTHISNSNTGINNTEATATNIYYIQDLIDNPIILIDNDNIKISIVEYLDVASWWEFGYKIKVENRSDKTITYLIDDTSIMDINCDPLFDVDHIESGHTAYFNIAWDKETLERCHIPYIDNIEFMIRVFDNNDWVSPALYGTKVLIKNEK
jgi:hypothetical protein